LTDGNNVEKPLGEAESQKTPTVWATSVTALHLLLFFSSS